MGFGDEIMAVGAAEVLHRSTGQKVAIGSSLRHLVHSPMEWHCPWVVQQSEPTTGSVLLRDCTGHRPYLTVKQPRERQCLDPAFRPHAGRLFFSEAEIDKARAEGSAGLVVFDPHTKGGFIHERNKRWPWGHWATLVKMLRDAGLEVLQVGVPGRIVLPGVRRADTTTVREALCVVSLAHTMIATEGLFSHATPGMDGVRSVVLWGDRTDPAVMGYAGQVHIQSPEHGGEVNGLYCGARWACDHCARSMESITPERVFRAVMS